VAQRHGQSVGLVQMVGTPGGLLRPGGRRRVHAVANLSPGAIEEFVDLVVPELRRGRYRQDYAGTTQCDHLMQEE
jgi:hypothetical protein